jgi:hypothetical protein
MKILLPAISAAIIIGFTACGGGKKEAADTTSATEQQTGGTEEKNESSSSDEPKNKRWEERRAKGDTLAMPYKDLQVYLPEVSGYTKEGGPKGSQANMPGMGSWSETSQEYVNGDKRLSIKIMDYNAAFQTFQGLTMVYSMGFSSEDDTRKQAQADLGVKDVFAYQTTYKTEPRSELAIVMADRFFIQLESNGETGEAFLRDVAKNMPLGKLASF